MQMSEAELDAVIAKNKLAWKDRTGKNRAKRAEKAQSVFDQLQKRRQERAAATATARDAEAAAAAPPSTQNVDLASTTIAQQLESGPEPPLKVRLTEAEVVAFEDRHWMRGMINSLVAVISIVAVVHRHVRTIFFGRWIAWLKREKEPVEVEDVGSDDNGDSDVEEVTDVRALGELVDLQTKTTAKIVFAAKSTYLSTLRAWQTRFPLFEVYQNGLQCKQCGKIKTKKTTRWTRYMEIHSAVHRKAVVPNATENASLEVAWRTQPGWRSEFIKTVKAIYFNVKHGISHISLTQKCVTFWSALCEDTRLHAYATSMKPNYLSDNSIRELLLCIGLILERKFLDELQNCTFWSMSFDGSNDRIAPRLVLTARYDKESTSGRAVVSRFLDLDEYHDHSAQGITKSVLSMTLHLPAAKFVSLSTDGCSTNSGELRGCAISVRGSLNAAAIWMWCSAHVLQLCLNDLMRHPHFKEWSRILRDVHTLFSTSDIREECFKHFQSLNTFCDLCVSVGAKIVEPGDTRWGSFFRCNVAVHDQLPIVVAAITSLAEKGDRRAKAVHESMTMTFVYCLCIMQSLLTLFDKASVALQRADLSPNDVRNIVQSLLTSLKTMKSNRVRCDLKDFREWTRTWTTSFREPCHPAEAEKVEKEINLHEVVDNVSQSVITRFEFVHTFSDFEVFDNSRWPKTNLGKWGEEHLRRLVQKFSSEVTLAWLESESVELKDGNAVYSARTIEKKSSTCHPPLADIDLDEVLREWTHLSIRFSDTSITREHTQVGDLLFSVHGEGYLCLRKMYTLFKVIECTSVASERQFSRNHWLVSPLRASLGGDSLWACMRVLDEDNDRLSSELANEVATFFFAGRHPWTERARKPPPLSQTLCSKGKGDTKTRLRIWE